MFGQIVVWLGLFEASREEKLGVPQVLARIPHALLSDIVMLDDDEIPAGLQPRNSQNKT